MGKSWEKPWKYLGKVMNNWDIMGKTMGKSWENPSKHGFFCWGDIMGIKGNSSEKWLLVKNSSWLMRSVLHQ